MEDLEQKDVKFIAPDIPELKPAQTVPVEAQFSVREGYNSAKLNIGNVYINGQLQADNKFQSNYYANSFDNTISNYTLASNQVDKIQVQLKAGDELKNKYDLSAKDILKKFLGDNLNNTTSANDKKITGTKLEDTKLYQKFLELNSSLKNFKNGDEILIQLSSLKVAPNGERYFTLIAEDNKVLYFDEKGFM